MIDLRRRPELVDLGADTGGAVSLEQCRAAGVSDDQAGWLVKTRRWQSPFPRVYVTFSGPMPLATLEHAALLYAGDASVLSHESAGHHWHVCRPPEAIHVTVPYPNDVAPQPGLIVHRSRTLTEEDIHPALSPRRTRIERTVVDLLADKHNADQAIGVVADAIRGRGTTPDRIRAVLRRLPMTRWRKVVVTVLPDIAAGAHSALEVRDATVRRRHNLPMGKRQAKRLADGTEWLDVLIEEYNMHVELDGRLGHDRAREAWRDMRRDNRSELQRKRHLRYGWADMFDRPCEVAIQQAVVLRQEGWTGRFTPCRQCPPRLPDGL
jgi:hypothetical protein